MTQKPCHELLPYTALIVVLLVVFHASSASTPPDLVTDWIYDTGGDDWLVACAVDGLGNVYVTGSYDLGSNRNLRTMKYGPDGTVEFNVIFDGGHDDFVSDVALDGDGNAYLAGESYQGDDYDACVVKYDGQGNQIWSIVADLGGIDRAQDIATDPDGFLHIVGEKGSSVNSDLYLMKATVNGDTAWTRTYDSGFDDWSASVGLDAWGYGYIAVNVEVDTLTVTRVSKYNWNGDIVWTSILPSDYDETCRDLAVDYDGNVYVAGYFYAGKEINSRITKYDTNGGQLWTRIYDSGIDDYIHGVITDGGGAVIASGSAADKEEDKLFLLKYDSSGTLQWASADESGESIDGFDIELDEDGFLYVAGTFNNGMDHDFRTQIYQQYLNISGRVIDDRSGVEGIPVILDGYYDLVDTTDADGNFSFLDLPCANYYRIYPDFEGATFDPPQYEYLTLGYDRTDQDFEVTLGGTLIELVDHLTMSIENPVSDAAVIDYRLPSDTEARLRIFDLTGRAVETIVAGKQSRGKHRAIWAPGRSGVFVVRLDSGSESISRHIVVIE